MIKKISCFFTGFALLTCTVLLTSSVPANRASVPDNNAPTTQQAATKDLKADVAPAPAPSDQKAQKVTYKELKTMATQLKGSKLTFKEKLALRLFGKKLANKSAARGFGNPPYSQVVALILVILVGGLGIHRFYLGYTWQGIVQLLTLGGCGIWALIDLVRICTGDLQPKDAQYDTTL